MLKVPVAHADSEPEVNSVRVADRCRTSRHSRRAADGRVCRQPLASLSSGPGG